MKQNCIAENCIIVLLISELSTCQLFFVDYLQKNQWPNEIFNNDKVDLNFFDNFFAVCLLNDIIDSIRSNVTQS